MPDRKISQLTLVTSPTGNELVPAVDLTRAQGQQNVALQSSFLVGPRGSTGAAGANGNASTLLVAGSWDTWIPGYGMFSGANGTGTLITTDNTSIGSWVGIYNGQVLNANGTITYHAAGYLSKPSGAFLKSANSATATAYPVTLCMEMSIDSANAFSALWGLSGGTSSGVDAYVFPNTGNPGINMEDGSSHGGTITDTNYTVGTTGLTPWTFTIQGNPVIYEQQTTWNMTAGLTGTVGGTFYIGIKRDGSSNGDGVLKIGAVSLYLSGLTTQNVTDMSTGTTGGRPWLGTPLPPPNTFAGQANTTVAANPTLQIAINAATGTYGGLLRETSASSGDVSSAMQTELNSNHHFELPERSSRTAQGLLMPDDGFFNGNHATIFSSAGHAAAEEDWIVGIKASVGGGVDTMIDGIIQNVLTDASATTGIRDGTSYGNGPPTQTMAGIWFADLSGKPSAAQQTVAHGRVLGGGARNCTYGLRLSAFQYSRAMDGRYTFNDVGVLIESGNGEGLVDFKTENLILAQNLIGVAVVANNTQQGFQGPLQAVVIDAGKHNGQSAGAVCHYGFISPWWRDGTHFQSGRPILRNAGTEFQLNNAGQPYSVGRTIYTKTFDTAVGTSGYVFGASPTPNLDGRAFVQQNANSTWWMCFYFPSCSYYVEGTTAVFERCQPADSSPTAVYRMGPYGIADIIDPGGAGQFTNMLTVADASTGRARMFNTADGISGYAQNLDRWPDAFTYAVSPFAFFVAGGQLPEVEVYRVITGNQPVWHPSSLASTQQDNVSEALATRSPGFPKLLQVTGAGSATTFTAPFAATEGIFNGRNVTKVVYAGTVNTTLGTCSQITTANNQPITPTFSAAAPANGRLCIIDSEVFYVISGGGSTSPTLARAQQNTTPATHAANATIKTVGAYLDVAATGQQITTTWLGGDGSAHDPGAAVDSSGFIFIHNTSGTGFWLNFDLFWSGNSKYSNGATRCDAYIGRAWVGPHQHMRISFGKGSYESDYKICWFHDALQGAVTYYVSGQMMYQSTTGLDSGTHCRMMQRGEWPRNILQ